MDAWVQVACPRLSMDWGSSAYSKPMYLGPNVVLEILRNRGPLDSFSGHALPIGFPWDERYDLIFTYVYLPSNLS